MGSREPDAEYLTQHLERMKQLIEGLGRARSGMRDDPQAAAVLALTKVLQFLDADPDILGAGLTEPIAVVANALYDLTQGARPPFFEPRKKPKGGRPSYLASDGARGMITFCVELLIKAGIKLPEAARFVADECGKLDLLLKRRAPDPGTLSRWFYEKGGTAPVLATEMHDRLINSPAFSGQALSPDQARQVVRDALERLASGGFL